MDKFYPQGAGFSKSPQLLTNTFNPTLYKEYRRFQEYKENQQKGEEKNAEIERKAKEKQETNNTLSNYSSSSSSAESSSIQPTPKASDRSKKKKAKQKSKYVSFMQGDPSKVKKKPNIEEDSNASKKKEKFIKNQTFSPQITKMSWMPIPELEADLKKKMKERTKATFHPGGKE